MGSTQIYGVIAGLVAGLIWEMLATSRFGHFRTLVPSYFVKEGGNTYHIHHWLAYAVILMVLLLISYKFNRLTHPAVLFLAAAILGAIAFNIIVFKDWNLFLISRPK